MRTRRENSPGELAGRTRRENSPGELAGDALGYKFTDSLESDRIERLETLRLGKLVAS
jgi:hypothetical protein